MRIRYVAVLSVTISIGAIYAIAPPGPANAARGAAAPVSFKEDVQPVFQVYCAGCHQPPNGEGYKADGLDLTSYQGVMKGTKFGPMVIPGQPDSSNLVVLVDGQAQIRMPYGHKPLPDCVPKNIWSWIFQGAKNN